MNSVAIAQRGDHYLVDLGELVHVAACGTADAMSLALVTVGGPEKVVVDRTDIYRLDPEGVAKKVL